MQLPIRPMEVLARPSDDLMWCPAVDSKADDSKDSCTDREFKQELRHQLLGLGDAQELKGGCSF